MNPKGNFSSKHRRSKSLGAAIIEYAVLLIFIAIIIIGALKTAGQSVSQVFSEAGSHLEVPN